MNNVKHWTSDTKAFVGRIASDFVAQIENRLEQKGETYTHLAERIGVTPGRVSQVLNNPGNLTLRNLVLYARVLGLKVAIVAYDDEDPDNLEGPIASEIFQHSWKQAGRPRDFFKLSSTSGMCQVGGAALPSQGKRLWTTNSAATGTTVKPMSFNVIQRLAAQVVE